MPSTAEHELTGSRSTLLGYGDQEEAMGASVDLYGGRDPRDVATYGLAEAARYLRLPATTLHAWVIGQAYETRAGRKRRVQPVILVPRSRPVLLSFWNLTEAYVLATIRRHHQVSLQKVRKALRFVQDELELKRPLIEQEFLTDGVDLFVDRYGRLINASQVGQVAMRKLLEASLRRIERDPRGLADRLFPWSKDPAERRVVEIDPRRAFGRMVITGTGVPTEAVAERWRAGDTIPDLSRDYRLDQNVIEDALRWELGGSPQ